MPVPPPGQFLLVTNDAGEQAYNPPVSREEFIDLVKGIELSPCFGPSVHHRPQAERSP
ncbi:MAG: hypothetical protein MZV64_04150 [Ignavibacteriales bacterium]|nr:hypothetical protein [Ignavibacteriales bacterium]